jgi:lipoyl(octanoyl) transferase
VDRELIFVDAGFGASAMPYLQAWDLQRLLHGRRASGQIPDTCLLLEHEPVYTAGKRTSPADRPAGDPGAPVIEVDRGGNITWHGPGQLVGYPIMLLDEPIDVIAYVRALEEALICTCAEFGVRTGRVQDRRGIWIRDGGDGPDRKVGQIGVRVSRGVTMHGFALNCDCDLSWFDRIVPCGIRDAAVTSLSAEAGRPVTALAAMQAVQGHLAAALGARSWRQADQVAGLAGTGQEAAVGAGSAALS